MWRETLPQGDIDYAISFESPESCHQIWDKIGEIQGQYSQLRHYGLNPTYHPATTSADTQYNYLTEYPTCATPATILPNVSRVTLSDLRSLLLSYRGDRETLVQLLTDKVCIIISFVL